MTLSLYESLYFNSKKSNICDKTNRTVDYTNGEQRSCSHHLNSISFTVKLDV